MKATVDLERARDLAMRLLESDDYLALLKRQMRDGTLPEAVNLLLWELAYGPPEPAARVVGVKKAARKPRLTLVKSIDENKEPASGANS
jgi:hypothetical protein